MIRHLTISNFKAFGSTQQVPLRPITLIFGPNSGGKSSILHSLKWSKHAVKFKALDFEASGDSDDSPDFGGFLGAVFGKKRDRQIRLEFQLPSEHAPDYRVSFQVGLWTKELKMKVLPEPEPSERIKPWLALRDEFHAAKDEEYSKVADAPFILDEDGELLRDEDGNLVHRDDLGERPWSGELAEMIRQEWRPRLAELWQKWRDENSKPGVEQGLDRYFARLAHYDKFLSREEADPVIFDFEIALGQRVLVRGERTTFDGGLRLTKLSRVLPEVCQFLDDYQESDPYSYASCYMDAPGSRVTHISQVLGIDDVWNDEVWSQDELSDCGEIEFLGLLPNLTNRSPLTDDRGPELEQGVLYESLQALIRDCRRRLERDLSNGTYLGPLRALPPRSLLMLGKDEKLGSVAAAWLRLRNDDLLRKQVNRWIGSEHLDLGYCYETQIFAELASTLGEIADEEFSIMGGSSWDLSRNSHEEGFETLGRGELTAPNVRDDESKAVSYWAEKLPHTMLDLILRDLRNNVVVSSRDVGIGISQLIPVVVHALAERETMIMVEQPELHLHPALQAKLGDLFIESALGGSKNQFILETHSEHLILRLLRRIRETTRGTLPDGVTPIRSEDVAILYVQPSSEGSKVIEMRIDEHGRLVDNWPNGFFEERLDELF
jgi:hypothetical protein